MSWGQAEGQDKSNSKEQLVSMCLHSLAEQQTKDGFRTRKLFLSISWLLFLWFTWYQWTACQHDDRETCLFNSGSVVWGLWFISGGFLCPWLMDDQEWGNVVTCWANLYPYENLLKILNASFKNTRYWPKRSLSWSQLFKFSLDFLPADNCSN